MPIPASPRRLALPLGFNVIELLIVVGILGILAAIIFVAVDPAKRQRQSRNALRASDSDSVLNAILNYSRDHAGMLPPGIDADATSSQMIGTGADCSRGNPCREASGGSTVAQCLDLSTELVAGRYLTGLPVDPLGTDLASPSFAYDAGHSGYYVQKLPNGRIEVGSCNPESGDIGSNVIPINVKR
jgi:type IV pilus assembly protein PilA